VSRQKFEEAFAKINENFSATFRKLFGGGHASCALPTRKTARKRYRRGCFASGEEAAECIATSPAVKRPLPPFPLLVGIFQYQPAPFCILDEVDAPLDEANVGRFTELVKEMSVKTQFVLITHSKKTMSICSGDVRRHHAGTGRFELVSVRFGAA